MGSLDQDALDELLSRSETLDIVELIRTLELFRVDDGHGVERKTVEAYAEELNYDLEKVNGELENRLVDDEDWQSYDAIYKIDDRVSTFPPLWHDELADTTDLTKHVGLIHEDVDRTEGPERESVTEKGVPEQKVIRAARSLSGMTQEEAQDKIAELRGEGKLTEPLDQYPKGEIRVADDEERDPEEYAGNRK